MVALTKKKEYYYLYKDYAYTQFKTRMNQAKKEKTKDKIKKLLKEYKYRQKEITKIQKKMTPEELLKSVGYL